MSMPVPVSLAAAADLLAVYGIIEVPRRPRMSTGILLAAGATMAALMVGLFTDWSLPPVDFAYVPELPLQYYPM